MRNRAISLVLAIMFVCTFLPNVMLSAPASNVFVQMLVEPVMEYFIVGGFSEGLARVEKDGKCGFIDKTGNIVIPLEYDSDRYSSFSEGLALVYKGGRYKASSQRIREGGKCGFIDKTGKIVIPLEFDNATAFSEGLAAVEKDGKQYLINKNGDIIVTLDTYYGDKTSSSDRMGIEPFSDGVAVVMKDRKWGFIDKTGKEVIPVGKYESAWRSFSEGLAAVGKLIPTGDEDYYKRHGEHSYNIRDGFIDKTGEIVIPFEYDSVSSFSDGLASVSKGSKWGVIDKTGKVVIPFEYDTIGVFSEGLMSFNKDGKQGYMDRTGKVVISLSGYERASFTGGALSPFRDGFAVVHSKLPADDAKGSIMNMVTYAKWGVIDKTGKKVIPLEYDYITSFKEGLAVVFIGEADFYHDHFSGKWGIIEVTSLAPVETASTFNNIYLNTLLGQ